MPSAPRDVTILAAISLGLALVGSFVGGEIGRLVGAALGHVGDETVADALLGGGVLSLVSMVVSAVLVAPRLRVPRALGWGMAILGLALDWAFFVLVQPRLGS